MAKTLWRKHIDGLDPETDFVEIVRTLVLHEFPWDMNAVAELRAVPHLRRAEHRPPARRHR